MNSKLTEKTQYRKLRKILLLEVADHDPNRLLFIKFELAILVDVTGAFHRACYNLEGDGPLAMVAYEQIEIVYDSLHSNLNSLYTTAY